MDVLCLFSGIRFQAEFEKEAQLQNNGETALRLYGVTGTVGFAASEDATVAVCVLPGTELAFGQKVKRLPTRLGVWQSRVMKHTTAIFRQINKEKMAAHHDALEFPDGQVVLLTFLSEGQQATVLQLPCGTKDSR